MVMCIHIVYLVPQSSGIAVVKWPLVWIMNYETKREKTTKCWISSV